MNQVIKISGLSASGNIVQTPPDRIKLVPNYNVRHSFDSVNEPEDAELKASIKARGYRGAPLIVRVVGSDIYLVAGHRRLAAVLELIKEGTPIKSVPVTMEDAGTTDIDRLEDLITSNTGKKLDGAEQGAVFLRLQAYKMKVPEIAAKFGVSEKWVREMSTLARSDHRLLSLVKAKIVSPTLAVETLRKQGAKTAEVIEAAAKVGTGANAGKATGATIAKVTGTPAKNSAGRVDRLQQNAAAHAEAASRAAAKPATTGKAPAAGKASAMPTKVVSGPFRLGVGMDDRDLLDANGEVMCVFPDEEKAKAMLALINQGWQTFSGQKLAPEPETELVNTAGNKAMAGKASAHAVIAGAASVKQAGTRAMASRQGKSGSRKGARVH